MSQFAEFSYHASGIALSGRVTRPFKELIPVQAGAILPELGGCNEAHVEHFRYKDMLSFNRAYTQVTGSLNPDDDVHNTLMSIVVEGLNVMDMLTADRMVARLTSLRRLTESETHVTPLGTTFENVRIGGYPLKIELDTTIFQTHDTHAGFKKAYESDAALRTELRERFLWNGVKNDIHPRLQQRYKGCTQTDTLPESDGATRCTLVKSLKCECPGVKCVGNAVVVPHFGIIYVAEYRTQAHRRYLTLLRLDLGCPVAGTMDVGEGQMNGNTG